MRRVTDDGTAVHHRNSFKSRSKQSTHALVMLSVSARLRLIFRILKKHHVTHTENNYGFLVNLTTTPDHVVAEISAFVDFCAQNRCELDDYDKRLNECKANQRYDGLPGVHPVHPVHPVHLPEATHACKQAPHDADRAEDAGAPLEVCVEEEERAAEAARQAEAKAEAELAGVTPLILKAHLE